MSENVLMTTIICITVIIIFIIMSQVMHADSEQTIRKDTKFNEILATMASRGATSEELRTFNFLYVKYMICQRKETDDVKMENKNS